MSPFKRGRMWWTRVRGQDGTSTQRSLGTSDKGTARDIEQMLASLRMQRDWGMVNAVASGAITVGELYDAYRMNTLDQLRARLSDVDLRSLVPKWAGWAEGRASAASVAKYTAQVEVLLSAGPFRSELTRAEISRRLANIDASGSTKKRYHAAWSSFFRYLVEIGVVDVNPLRSIQAPRGNPARELWLSLEDMKRVIEAQPLPFASLSMFLHGTGVEISAALRTRVRDVNRAERTVWAHGTKTRFRKRLVRVDDWAWMGVLTAIEGKMPDALLWPLEPDQDTNDAALKRAGGQVYRKLKSALAALPDLPQEYDVHDARHSYAVRHIKLGTGYPRIAHNLGHVDAMQVFKVYGKHKLSDSEVAGTQSPPPTEQEANQ